MANGAWTVAGNENNPPNAFLGTTDANPLIIMTSGTERMRVDSNGNVGVGTNSPGNALHLGPNNRLRIEGPAASDEQACVSLGGNGTFGIDAPGIVNGRFVVAGSGNVGIAAPTPQFGLHLGQQKALRIEGALASGDTTQYFSFGGNGTFGIDAPGVVNGRFVVQDSGNVGIGTDAPASKLDVKGDITVSGDLLLAGADCAEEFNLEDDEQAEPGTVVVINESGALRESRQAYDRRVAGVVSGAGTYRAGLVLDRQANRAHRIQVALVGKVWCKVDAAEYPVGVGDLLTTSETPGHAMKAADPVSAFGAVIGKALRPLAHGRGLVPILVALQ